MRTVSKEESENTKNNLLNMGREGKITKGGVLGEWIFSRLYPDKHQVPIKNELVQSLTKNAVQKNWKTQSEFPLCPEVIGENALAEYCQKLEKAKVFAIDKYKQSSVYTAKVSDSSDVLLVICHHPDGAKEWSLAKVFIKDQKFVHESLGTFFQLKGAEKEFTIALGLKWEGGETFDELVG
jgi:pterin-4a-carbinolamine dehydratase